MDEFDKGTGSRVGVGWPSWGGTGVFIFSFSVFASFFFPFPVKLVFVFNELPPFK